MRTLGWRPPVALVVAAVASLGALAGPASAGSTSAGPNLTSPAAPAWTGAYNYLAGRHLPKSVGRRTQSGVQRDDLNRTRFDRYRITFRYVPKAGLRGGMQPGYEGANSLRTEVVGILPVANAADVPAAINAYYNTQYRDFGYVGVSHFMRYSKTVWAYQEAGQTEPDTVSSFNVYFAAVRGGLVAFYVYHEWWTHGIGSNQSSGHVDAMLKDTAKHWDRPTPALLKMIESVTGHVK